MSTTTTTSITTATIVKLRVSINNANEEEKEYAIDECVAKGFRVVPNHDVASMAKPKLRFGSVSIREYPVIVGDNPGGISGPPLSIDWQHHSEMTVDLISFEEQRPARRHGREMLVPVDVRFERLRGAGYSRAEIVTLTKPVNIARSQRKRTLDTMHLQKFHRFNERLARKTKSFLTGGRQKKSEKKLMNNVPSDASSRLSVASSSHSTKSVDRDEDQSTDENCLSLLSLDEISPSNSEDSEVMI